jgi:hypothetical protein
MALTVNHPTLKEQTVYAHSPSIGTTPIVAVARSPYRGKVVKVGLVMNGAITTANVSTAVNIIPNAADGTAPGAGTAISGSPLVLSFTNSAAGSTNSFVPSSVTAINEDDLITFTPSGATGASVTGTYYAVIQVA